MTRAPTADPGRSQLAPADSPPADRDGASFRDPSGFVFWRDGRPYRQIQPAFAAEWDAFDASAFKRRLVDERRLIGHETVERSLAATPGAHAVIRPEPIDFISYPWEWTFGELRDAALLTLDVQLAAIAAGWTLKDASAFNVQFQRGRPILIDSLSFEPLEEGSPWVAYRQFCEQFLAPLALAARRDVRLLGLLRTGPDGVPLDLASRLLPWRTRLDFGLLSHLHVHARAQARHAAADDGGRRARRPSLSRTRLEGLVRNLRSTTAALDWRPAGTEWADYAEHTSYRERAAADKDRLVDGFVRDVPGDRVWDLGANTGRFSWIAADAGKRVIALDIDPAAAERHYRAVRDAGREDILPLVRHFISTISNEIGKPLDGISERGLELLLNYDWPGNIRELENMLERAIVLSDGPVLGPESFPLDDRGAPRPSDGSLRVPPIGSMTLDAALERLERTMLERALDQAGGVKTKTAELLGIKTSALYYKLEKYGLTGGQAS